MNERRTEAVGDETIDLLIDGELDPESRREILRRLEGEPGGWRRCALAFLEAQSFRGAFAATVAAGAPEPPAARARREFPSGGRPSGRWMASMAAAALVAFGIGLSMGAGGGSGPGPGRSGAGAEGGSAPGEDGKSTLAVRLGSGGESGKGEVRVPLFEVSPSDPSWDWMQEAMGTDDLVRRLEEAGHQVSERRRFIGVTLSDGREAVVPVDEYEVRPVSYRKYR